MVMLKGRAWWFLLLNLLASAWGGAIAREAPLSGTHDSAERVVADVVLKGGTLVDGTGPPRRQADVAMRGDRIVAVGSFEVDPKAKVIDVSSLIVAPGFIDLHTHSDPGITQPTTRLNRNYLTQGVTTIVTGNCGLGVLDVAKYLAAIDAHGAGTNVIHLVPHGTVRSAVMGNAERPPSSAELERMKQPGRAGHGGRCLGTVERLDLRARPIRRHARADRAGQGRRAARGHLRLAHPQRREPGCSNRSTRPSRSARERASRCTSRT